MNNYLNKLPNDILESIYKIVHESKMKFVLLELITNGYYSSLLCEYPRDQYLKITGSVANIESMRIRFNNNIMTKYIYTELDERFENKLIRDKKELNKENLKLFRDYAIQEKHQEMYDIYQKACIEEGFE